MRFKSLQETMLRLCSRYESEIWEGVLATIGMRLPEQEGGYAHIRR